MRTWWWNDGVASNNWKQNEKGIITKKNGRKIKYNSLTNNEMQLKGGNYM